MSVRQIFKRVRDEPILSVDHLPFPAAAVLNPGAAEQNGETVLLLRVEDTTGRSSIHTARSANGVDNWRVDATPILRYGEIDYRYEQWGCEDARVTYLADQGTWYITYTAASAYGPSIALARSDDLVTAERLGLIFPPNNKDGVLLPQRCGGQYVMLHRPDAGGIEHIWNAYSNDLTHWGNPNCVLPEGAGPAWDAVRVGAGPPPILTDRGWLLIYHGVKGYAGRFLYRAGVALLDREQPHIPLIRSPEWIFQATVDYELTGIVPGVVFPTGLLQRGDELWLYYGAADTSVGLAIAKLDDVLGLLEDPRKS